MNGFLVTCWGGCMRRANLQLLVVETEGARARIHGALQAQGVRAPTHLPRSLFTPVLPFSMRLCTVCPVSSGGSRVCCL